MLNKITIAYLKNNNSVADLNSIELVTKNYNWYLNQCMPSFTD